MPVFPYHQKCWFWSFSGSFFHFLFNCLFCFKLQARSSPKSFKKFSLISLISATTCVLPTANCNLYPRPSYTFQVVWWAFPPTCSSHIFKLTHIKPNIISSLHPSPSPTCTDATIHPNLDLGEAVAGGYTHGPQGLWSKTKWVWTLLLTSCMSLGGFLTFVCITTPIWSWKE